MDSLNNQWNRARQDLRQVSAPAAGTVLQRRAKKQSVLSFHYSTIIILSVTLVVLIFFFYTYTPFNTVLSWIGVGVMVGGLFLRIVVEIISARRYATIHVEHDTAAATHQSLQFYEFRKKIHGPLTITIVGLYIVGFYMLSPEFSLHFSTGWMLFMDIGFAFGAVIMTIMIRKGIRQELETLKVLTDLRREIEDGRSSSLP
ncbi:MAG: hypothetical protein EOO00_10690 [Chitinophagaceae bacterium]|nr:MAG: hypothetical protein EOO00_10690 [Chitinophagaceae bacterium]